MNTPQEPVEQSAVSKLLKLEAMARAASSREALQFMIVNETRQLISYRQAYLFLSNNPIKRKCRLVSVASIAVIERNAPFVEWMESTLAKLFDSESIAKQNTIDMDSCPENVREGWEEYSLPHMCWTPLKMSDGTFIGGLWMSKETQWQQQEMALMQRLADTYAHAYVSITSKRNYYPRSHSVTVAAWVILVFLLLVLLKPISLSALAPVEITAKDPVVVTAPMDGVIALIPFEPNTRVSKGETLFVLEDTKLRNEFNVSEKTLAVAEAEYKKAAQDAFRESKSKAQIALLRAQAELNKSKLEYARELLEKINVVAEKSGVLIYTDKTDWIGKPVMVGERIMEIADPDKIQLRINLAIDDAIVLKEGADVEIFLDADPLNPLKAKLVSSSYQAEKYNQTTLSYRVYAEFQDIDNSDLRIGLQGTAKIYGEKVSLFFYLFRRPISYLRQLIGV